VIARVLDRLAARYDIDRFVRNNGESAFRILIGCLISLRTKDEVSYAATERLFRRAADPQRMSRLRPETIAKLIYPAGFYRRKAEQIREISRELLRAHAGRVPDDIDRLIELPGVGRKTANLVVTLGFNKPGICVDTHVHRITNRLNWVRTDHPDRTEQVLRHVLPRRHWIPINETLVRHGQQICKPLSPICSECPVERDCPKRDVGRRR
jgi:endonuclease-3